MTELEDAIRRALRAHAGEVQPPLPPLDIRPRRTSGSGGRLLLGPWIAGQLRWLGPAAAVITVLAVTATALLLRGADNGSGTAPAATIETSVPPYYVALISATTTASSVLARVQTVATVRATATGSEVASVAPPAPYTTFLSVSGATGDRTFVLLASGPKNSYGVQSERFYLLHIDPQAASAADRTRLTALPAGDIPGSRQVAAMALSPNGASLAAILISGFSGYLYVYNLQTESARIWTKTVCYHRSRCVAGALGTVPMRWTAASPAAGSSDPPALSWTQDSQALAFIPGGRIGPLRILHIGRPGSNVKTDSTAFPIHHLLGAPWNWAVLTPDGKTVFIGDTQYSGGKYFYGLARFSSATGKFAFIYKQPVFEVGHPNAVYQQPEGEGIDEVVWTSYDGSEAVVLDIGTGHSAGIYAGSHYTPLPWPRSAFAAAW